MFIQREDPVLSVVAPVSGAPLAVKRTPLVAKRPTRTPKSKTSKLNNQKRAVGRVREPLIEVLSDDDNSSDEEILPYSKRSKAILKPALKSARNSVAINNNNRDGNITSGRESELIQQNIALNKTICKMEADMEKLNAKIESIAQVNAAPLAAVVTAPTITVTAPASVANSNAVAPSAVSTAVVASTDIWTKVSNIRLIRSYVYVTYFFLYLICLDAPRS